jgi:hypothetical protein
MGVMRIACMLLHGKREGERKHGRSRPGWEDNVINLKETGFEGVD